MIDYVKLLNEEEAAGRLPSIHREHIQQFMDSYMAATARQGGTKADIGTLFLQFVERVEEQVKNPHHFEPYHHRITEPFNYYRFGVDIMSGVIDHSKCTRNGFQYVDEIEQHMRNKENVVLLANHQTEPDPHVLSILLEETHPHLAEEVIFVAGERVLTDPMAVPYSLGRNLLCVHSKKHIDNPPEKRAEKQAHNQRTMRAMLDLLSEGGYAIYVAPSGGRDRAQPDGTIPVAPFDPPAIEMFRLMAARSGKPCHFYPMALGTYHLLPPPDELGTEIGEPRYTSGGGVHVGFGPEIDMNHIPGTEGVDRQERREVTARYVWSLVNGLYEQFPDDARKV
jgi:glycerol-3-phosphate O-acyltransferase